MSQESKPTEVTHSDYLHLPPATMVLECFFHYAFVSFSWQGQRCHCCCCSIIDVILPCLPGFWTAALTFLPSFGTITVTAISGCGGGQGYYKDAEWHQCWWFLASLKTKPKRMRAGIPLLCTPVCSLSEWITCTGRSCLLLMCWFI